MGYRRDEGKEKREHELWQWFINICQWDIDKVMWNGMKKAGMIDNIFTLR